MHKKFDEDRMSSSRDMLADRQTDTVITIKHIIHCLNLLCMLSYSRTVFDAKSRSDGSVSSILYHFTVECSGEIQ